MNYCQQREKFVFLELGVEEATRERADKECGRRTQDQWGGRRSVPWVRMTQGTSLRPPHM